MKTEEEELNEQADAYLEKVHNETKALKTTLAAAERAQAKLTRAGRHVEAVQFSAKKAKLQKLIKSNTDLADTIGELHANRALRGFLGKTMMLSVSAIDLATYYADAVNNFFARHEVQIDPKVVAAEEAGRKALTDLRELYIGRLRVGGLDEQAINVFDIMERLFAENLFTDRERVYYEEYSK